MRKYVIFVNTSVAVRQMLEYDSKTRQLEFWEMRGWALRKTVLWSVTIDRTFDVETAEFGTMASRPTLPRAAVGAAIGGTTGAIVGSAFHKKHNDRGAWMEITGQDFHEIIAINDDATKAVGELQRLAVRLRQDILDDRKHAVSQPEVVSD